MKEKIQGQGSVIWIRPQKMGKKGEVDNIRDPV
jgi:hypothetical protein